VGRGCALVQNNPQFSNRVKKDDTWEGFNHPTLVDTHQLPMPITRFPC